MDSDSVIYKKSDGKSVIILPGLAFDFKGNRIGYGGGYYDNYMKCFENELSNGNMNSIAIGYDFQYVQDDISEFMTKSDIKTNVVITDKEIYRT